MRDRLVVMGVLLAAATAASAAAPASVPGKRPNVLFLFSDDQRADTIAALGNPRVATPNLDRLAAEGTAFTRAYCMGSDQGAVCVPSRAMLMSGRTLFRVNSRLAGQTTWPEMFARAGYARFMSGKWHNGPESAARAFPEARAVFLGGMSDQFKVNVSDIVEGKVVNKRVGAKHSAELFADEAVGFLKRQAGADKPFLCYVAFTVPHDPRDAPKEFHDKYSADPPALPGNHLPQHPFDNGELTVRDERLAPWPRTEPVVRKHLADYYACITAMDAQIGRILEALRESGKADDTIVVFSSDHGLAIGSHGLMGKQNLYDHSMRSPLILAGPGVPKGGRCAAMCYLLDILPTVGELAGVAAPEGSEGRSLVPAMKGDGAGRPAILTAYRNVQRAVRDDRWKLIAYPQINRVQLFDLAGDPGETKDLSADPAHAADLARMTALLKAEQERFGDKQALTVDKPRPAEFDFTKVRSEPKTKKKAG